MAKKLEHIDISIDNPMLHAGDPSQLINEKHVREIMGVSWSTWEQHYRTRIPGFTRATGRWYVRRLLTEYLESISTCASGDSRTGFRNGMAKDGH